MKANKEKIVLYSSFALYCIWTILSAIRHEPYCDEYHVWGMVYNMSFPELWKAMSTEGHFILWHLLQWPFVKWFGMDYHCLYCVSVPLMILATWLLLFKIDFNLLGKLLIIFSAPFCYYFPVMARCYALIPPILAGLAVLHQKNNHPLLYCVLLGLLANTHAYIEGLVAILWCLFMYNQVFVKWKVSPDIAKKNLCYSFATILMVIFALIQVVGSIIAMKNGWHPIGEGVNSTEDWFARLNHGYYFQWFEQIHERIHIVPNIDAIIIIILWVCIIIGLTEIIKSAFSIWQLILILVIGIGWQIFFACNIYGMNWHRVWLVYFVLIYVMWIAYARTIKTKSTIVLLSLWILTSSSRSVVVRDIFTTTHTDAGIAASYDSLLVKPSPCYTNAFAGPHDMLKHKCRYYPFDTSDTISTEEAINHFLENTNNCYLMTDTPILIHKNAWKIDTIKTINSKEDVVKWNYYVYFIEK